VLGIKPQHKPQTVYNLEVQGQHVFRVTSNGLLVHNSCLDEIAKLADDTAKKIFGKGPNRGFTGQFGKLDPNDIRFSQNTAGGRGRGRASQLRDSMKDGWNGPAVDAIRTPDGITTIDNTRIAVARELGIPEVPVKVRLPSDPLPKSMLGCFGDANTWGEALLHRTGRQRPPLGPTGSPMIPRIPNSN
jgi:hypothetical protein